jgi:hypothetical protein
MLRRGEPLPGCLPAHTQRLADLIPCIACAARRLGSCALDRVEVPLKLRGGSQYFKRVCVSAVDQAIPRFPGGEILAHSVSGCLDGVHLSRPPDAAHIGDQPAGRTAHAHSLLRMSASATDVSVDPLSFEGSPCKRLGVQAFLRLNFDRRRNVGAAKSYNRLSIVGYWNRLPVPY